MRTPTTFRLKQTTRALLAAMAEQEEKTRTAMLEKIVKEAATTRQVSVTQERQDASD